MRETTSWLLPDEMSEPSFDPGETVRRILERKSDYGITRIGSVTGLDWIGIPVVQVVRPRSLSVVVSQGKGLTPAQAAISGLMETLEGWAAERIARERVVEGTFAELDPAGCFAHLGAKPDMSIDWINGRDLISGRTIPVPLGLVDTVYTFASPHPPFMPRDTTGLAAGTSVEGAVVHAGLECLERHARCQAMKMPHFFDRFQMDLSSIPAGNTSHMIETLSRAGFLVGIWQIPAAHELPVYWCHVMEDGSRTPFAPLPGEGFACGLTHEAALTSALLEACQSRLGVISAAREDISADLYRFRDDRQLADWRHLLRAGGRKVFEADSVGKGQALKQVMWALELAGAKAAIVIVLHSDESIPVHVVRLVTPPLATNPEGQDA